MRVKGFDKLQHYYLDAVWRRIEDGKDVPATLVEYASMSNVDADVEDFLVHLHRQLRDYPAVDPDHGKWRTWGFVVPFNGQPVEYISNPLGEGVEEQHLAVYLPGTTAIVLCVEKRERVLPSSAINDKLFERAKEMKEREERELTRKDYAILKDEVTAQLLKTAPVRRVRTYVMMDGADLFVFTGSQKAAEETNAIIRMAFSSFPTVPAYQSEVLLQELFKKILRRDQDTLNHGSYVKLRNEEKEVVTVKDGDLDDERYTDMIDRGFTPIELEFHCVSGVLNMDIWVKMNHKGDIKALSTAEDDDLTEDFHSQYEVGEAGYQSKIAELWVLHKVIGNLTSTMAGTGVMFDRQGEIKSDTDTGDELDPEHGKQPEDEGDGAGDDALDQDATSDGETEDDDEWAI